MSIQQIVPHVYQVSLTIVNAYLLDLGDQLVLIDTGTPGSADKILTAVGEIGRQASDITHILVTHLHADHTGSLAVLKAATNAPAYMHPADAELVRRGESLRPATAAPGLFNKLLVNVGMRLLPMGDIEPVTIEREVHDNQILTACGGLEVIHVPGHSAGQVAFLWPEQGGVLFGGDVASRMTGRLTYPPILEDRSAADASLARVAALSFEIACLGHGRVMTTNASTAFREKWG